MAVTKGSKRRPNTIELGFVKSFAVQLAYSIQCIGYGKYHMKMLYVQSITHAVFDPKHLPGYLTFGAMTISTTIITETFMSTTVVIALVFVPAQGYGSTLQQDIERSQRKSIGITLAGKVRPKPFNDLGYFIFRTFHYF